MAKPVPTTERDERPRRLSARVTGHAEGRRNLQGTSVWGVVVRGRRHRGGDRDDKADDAGVDRVDADNPLRIESVSGAILDAAAGQARPMKCRQV